MKKLISGVAVSSVLLGLSALPAHATASTNNDADLVGDSAFVRNSWVQAGLKLNGSFGSADDAPAGYNSLLLDADPSDNEYGNLGLIADTNEDGFGGNDDGGDFFLPGSPYEGWGIKVDGNDPLTNTDSDTAIAGSWTSSETSGDASVTWQSTSAADGIEITQVVSAPAAGDHLIHVAVTLHNTDSAAHTVFYARQVDPDNGVDPMIRDGYQDEDGYSTFNRVQANSASSQIVTGTSYYNYTTIGYRATDADAAVRISDWSWPLGGANGEDDYYTQEEMSTEISAYRTTYRPGYQDNLDSTIDIAFEKNIAAGASATVEFDYILSPALGDVPEYALDLSLDLEVGADYADTSSALAGGGLAPNSDYTLTEYSTPRLIFSGTTLPNGNFYDETALPSDCRPGSHHLVLSGTSPSGAKVSDYVTYTVDENCVVTAFDPYAGAAGDWNALAETGADVSPYLMFSGFAAALGAAATVIARRRRIAE